MCNPFTSHTAHSFLVPIRDMHIPASIKTICHSFWWYNDWLDIPHSGSHSFNPFVIMPTPWVTHYVHSLSHTTHSVSTKMHLNNCRVIMVMFYLLLCLAQLLRSVVHSHLLQWPPILLSNSFLCLDTTTQYTDVYSSYYIVYYSLYSLFEIKTYCNYITPQLHVLLFS